MFPFLSFLRNCENSYPFYTSIDLTYVIIISKEPFDINKISIVIMSTIKDGREGERESKGEEIKYEWRIIE